MPWRSWDHTCTSLSLSWWSST